MIIFLVLLNLGAYLLNAYYRRFTILGNLGFYFFSFVLIYHFFPALFHSTQIAENPLHALFGVEVQARWLWYLTVANLAGLVTYNLVYGRPKRDPALNRLQITQNWRKAYNFSRPVIVLFITTALIVMSMYIFLLWRPMAIGYWIQGITGQFFNELLQFAGFVVIANQGMAFFIPIVILQAFFYMVTTQRLLVLVGLMATFFQIHRHAYKFRMLTLLATGFLAIGSFLLIYMAREQYGREYLTETNLAARLKAVASASGESEGKWQALTDEFFQRTDGNLFALMVMQSTDSGNRWSGLQSISSYYRLLTPRFINKNKQDTILELEEETFLVNHYMIPTIDYLPTLMGTFYSYYGVPSLLIFSIAFAAFLGYLDRIFTYRTGLIPLVLTNYLIICLGFYEQGPRPFFITGRGTMIILVIVFLFELAGRNTRKQQ